MIIFYKVVFFFAIFAQFIDTKLVLKIQTNIINDEKNIIVLNHTLICDFEIIDFFFITNSSFSIKLGNGINCSK